MALAGATMAGGVGLLANGLPDVTGGAAAVRGPVLMALGLGLVFLVAVGLGVFLGVRAVVRNPGAKAVLPILAAAFASQCWLASGAPYWTGDELVNFSSSLTAAFTYLDLVSYPHPALYFNLGTGVFGLAAGFLSVVGGIPLEEAALRVAAFHSTEVLVACRCLSALAWTGVLATVNAGTVALCGRAWAGVAAMLALAAADLLYTTSFSPYPLGVLFCCLAVHHVVLARPERPVDPRWAAMAGAWFGLAIGSHYLSLILLPAAATALIARAWRRPVASVAAFGGALLLAFVATNPRLVVNLPDYLGFWGFRLSEVATFDVQNTRSAAAASATGPLFYLRLLSVRILPWLAIPGLVVLGVRLSRTRDPRLLGALALPLWLLVLLSSVATKYQQYLLFLVPSLAVAAMAGIAWALEQPAVARFGKALAAGVVVLAALDALVVSGVAMGSYRSGPGLLAEAPESELLRAVATLPPGARVGVTSPTLALPRLAVTEGRIPGDAVRRFGQLFRERTGRAVSWVDVPAGGERASHLAGVDWLYALDWGISAPLVVPMLPQGSDIEWTRLRAGLSHGLFRLRHGAGEGGPPSSPDPYPSGGPP